MPYRAFICCFLLIPPGTGIPFPHRKISIIQTFEKLIRR
jgi:hypothetical protein